VSSVALLFIGAVLLVNGLTLIGRIEAAAAAPVNAIVGALLVANAVRLALPSGADEAALTGSAGFLLFGVTYLWVALNAWTRHPAAGLGWYCGWAAGISAFLGGVAWHDAGDAKLALLWLLWAVLFAAFFAVIALDRKELAAAVGWLALLEALVTTSVPGAMLLVGAWSALATAWVAGATVATVATFAVLAVRASRMVS
jgi:hypothetical protein